MGDSKPQSGTGGPVMVWDHEDCPLDDCDGEIQQQDKFNVMCLECETAWTHVKSETKHYLQTADFETVAEKPVAMTDGGNRAESVAERLREEANKERQSAHEKQAMAVGIENGDLDPERVEELLDMGRFELLKSTYHPYDAHYDCAAEELRMYL